MIDLISSPGSVESSEFSETADREAAAGQTASGETAGGLHCVKIMDAPANLPTWDVCKDFDDEAKREIWNGLIQTINTLNTTAKELRNHFCIWYDY